MLGRDKLCAVVAAPDARSMRRQLARALEETRTVELRLDWLSGDSEIIYFLEKLAARPAKATLIATCRRREAGANTGGRLPSSCSFWPKQFVQAAPGMTWKLRPCGSARRK